MQPASFEAQWPTYRRASRTVVVVDLVESVRLIEQDEEDAVHRWQAIVSEVVATFLPRHGGRLVKSLGDGLMLEFETVPPAIQCALAMQSSANLANTGRPNDRWMCLRIGAHVADVIVDELDIYGSGVNLAARLTTLAGAGEIVVSANVREQLLPGLDADVEDLGDCFVKHLQKPVRAYRVGPLGHSPVIMDADTLSHHLPVIAVVPLTVHAGDDNARFIGDIVADDIIAALSTSAQWKVISRLSSAVFRDRPADVADLAQRLHATYVLSGTCHLTAPKLRVLVELADARTQTVVWSGSVAARVEDLTDPHSELALSIAEQVGGAIFSHELARTRSKPMPTLESYTLLFAAISLMHRLSLQDFERSHAMLEHLVERHPHAPAPKVWMGKWHVMKVAQGWSTNRDEDNRLAQTWVQRALDQQPDHSLGLAIDGLIHGYLMRDLDTAQARYEAALSANPNESLAWLYSSALYAYQGRGEMAADAALNAISLSPLDPLRYYYDSFATHAMLAAGRYAEAVRFGRQSLRANCTHGPTFRSLSIALVRHGEVDEARQTIRRMLALEPHFTIKVFRERYPLPESEQAERYCEALHEAGLPEG